MQRRTFLSGIVTTLRGAIACVVGIPVLRILLDPLWRPNRQSDFVRVAPLSATSAGHPLRAVVNAARQDAYVRHPPAPVGSVWLMRCETAEDALAIRCVQAMCPHLGCGIDFVPDRRVFTCPCHASEFDAAGQRRFGPSPRDMDELECRVSPPDERGERWIEVKYVEFRTGIPQKRSAT